MRSLIRPILFTAARLGTFLAVVSWILGQWWFLHVSVPDPMAARAFDLSFCSHGWVLGWMSRSKPRFHTSVVPRNGFCPVGWAFVDYSQESANSNYRVAPGLNLCHVPLIGRGMSWMSVSVRHWLNVVCFTLFYAVLKFIYRRRPESAPAGM